MSKISIFGVSASGKTCFLYAMAQVLKNGLRCGDSLLQVISNRTVQQMRLNDGYMQLLNHRWPQTSDKTETFDFRVSMQCNGHFSEVIPSLKLVDYRGGLLLGSSTLDEKELNGLMDSFRGSSAIVFIIDGETILEALSNDCKDISHRGHTDHLVQFQAQSQICLVENIFMEYKRFEEDIPPILIAISKGDIFASVFERLNAVDLIKRCLPSFFSKGSRLTVGITIMSLGQKLGTGNHRELLGDLNISTDYNLHVPAMFGIYADLCYQYEELDDKNEKKGIEILLSLLRKLFADRIQLFINGGKARKIESL